jgi:hypothetical protein
MALLTGSYIAFTDENVSHVGKVMHAREDSRSRPDEKTKSIEAVPKMIVLTRKLDTAYATSVSRKLYVQAL